MSQIKVGDLVMVISADCPDSMRCALGRIRTVNSIGQRSQIECKCNFCGHQYNPAGVASLEGFGAPLSWLKRIPPLSELEGEKRDEDLKVPA